jgi:ABC-type multidrug transport system fused ATPase/permease subunit
MVFEGLSLTIKKGSSTGIIGESGSGKSTLLSLLQNLYPLKEGNITIGGLDLQYISNKSLRKAVSVVPQQIDLFAGTVIENIAFGDYEHDIQRILELSKMLGISDFIEQLASGYNSLLGEQGVNLSGGQRQRIAIARALYGNPEIFILDEATSNLDQLSESKVQETLEWFKSKGKKIILIANRLNTIKNCDEILVLKEGKLVEQGTHNTLSNNTRSYYYSFWKKQLKYKN